MAKASAARVFFDIVGTLQAQTLISDTRDVATVQQAILMDAINNITDNFDMASTAIMETVKVATDAYYEYERQLARVRKFYNGNEEAVRTFAEASVELGESFAFTGAEALTASARTAQLKGVLESQSAIIEATRAGLLMSAVGEMETELGMNRFIALAQQTQFLYGGLTKAQYDALTAEQQANIVRGNSIRVLNQLNTVENSSVATMEDITFVLNQFASQADIAGESIGDMAAMSALLLETGEEVSRAGTGLRMIYQRIGNENSEAVKALQQLMGGVDASVVTQMKLSDVIREITPAYQAMTAEQKRALAVSVAGSRHYVKFLKLMENSERLAELQSVAYEGQYSALDEFAKISETAAFQQQQLNAAVTNLSASIGDKLTDAYQQAAKAQYHMLDMADKALENKTIGSLAQNIVGAAAIYQNMVKPLTESGMAIMNTVIAFKTLQGVQRSMDIEERHRLKTRSENMMMLRFIGQAEKENIVITQQSKNASVMYSEAHRHQTLIMKGANYEITKINANLGLMRENLIRATDAIDKEEMAWNTYTGQLETYSHMQSSMALGMKVEESVLASVTARLEQASVARGKYAIFGRTIAEAEANYNILQKSGIQGLVERVSAQQGLNNALTQYHALMNQELQILIPLSEAEMRTAMNTLRNNEATLQSTRANIGNLQSLALRYQIQGKQVPAAIEAEIKALQKEATALQNSNVALRNGIMASNQMAEAKRAEAAATATTTAMTIKDIPARMKSATAASVQAVSIERVQRSLMPIAMILPLITKGENQMAAMMASTALMMVSMIPKIEANTAAKTRNAAATAAMSGGMSLLLAAGIATAAYFGAKTFGAEWFKDPLDDINALNEGLIDFQTTLTSIMEKEGPIKTGIIEESFSDITGPEQAADMVKILNQEYAQLDLALKSLGKNDALRNELEGEQKAIADAIAELEAYSSALIQHAKLKDIIESGGEYDAGMESGFFMRTRKIQEMLGEEAEYIADNEKIGFLNRLDYRKDFYIEYTDLEGNFQRETFKNQKLMNERIAELQESFDSDAITAAENYLDSILNKNKAANASLIDENQQMMGTLLGDMYEFSNAREELFFGQRSNFQGALYKQITQGGVENLMYKTEILQTNIFNGMTLPEMVESVTQGVLTKMREQGIQVGTAAGI